jgi:Ca-activated chloride channel family protein
MLSAYPQAVQPCDLALVLLQDTSKSIEDREFEVMREGLAAALSSAEVVEELGSGRVRLVVAVYGRQEPQVVVDWIVADPEVMQAAAFQVSEMPRAKFTRGTRTGTAMMWGAEQALSQGCARAVVDIATDGESNIGPLPAEVRLGFDPGAVTINGLFIGTDPRHREHLETVVRFGFGSFVLVAETWEDFADAMRKKLLREVAEALSERKRG